MISEMKDKPSMIITIDTEGDNLWLTQKNITTNNARYLYRFQELCEVYGFKPTYLTNYEMANSTSFQELGKDVIKRNTGEIGMHLHAWNNPPAYSLTENDYLYQPYLIEYPTNIIEKKVNILTQILEDTFQIKMLSHRGGRWSFDERYAKILIDHGYLVDCSVTPLCSWKNHQGDPKQKGGTDYTNFPGLPYYIDLDDISTPGDSPLLEIPMTIENIKRPWIIQKTRRLTSRFHFLERITNHYIPTKSWLRPNGRNLRDMLSILNNVVSTRRDYAMFMLHSSELMPGGSPTFRTKQSIEKLYSDMEIFFMKAAENFVGQSLADFRVTNQFNSSKIPKENGLRCPPKKIEIQSQVQQLSTAGRSSCNRINR